MIVTSPPYFGLRAYSGDQGILWPTMEYSPMPGLPPLRIQGCEPGCAHEWGDELPSAKYDPRTPEQLQSTSTLGKNGSKNTAANSAFSAPDRKIATQGAYCIHCSGWRGALGLEESISAYIGHLILVMRELWRVLRDDGLVFWNISDSYSGSGGAHTFDHASPGLSKSASRDGVHKYKVDGGRAPDKKVDGLRPKNLMGVPQRFMLAAQADGWIVRSAMPWIKRNCLSGGAIVYARTQKGDSPMMIKDLARLRPETVKLWNGTQWTQMLGIWEHDRDTDQQGAIEIELRSGQRIGCTMEHRWPTARGLLHAHQLIVGDVIDTCALPESERMQTPAGLPDDDIGWLVGLYLAEGCISTDNVIAFAGHIKEDARFQRLQRIMAAYGATCRRHETGGNNAPIHCYSKIVQGIIRTYISGDSAKTKHLLPACWMRSDSFLNSLLLGYLEGDGHYDAVNDRWRLGFTNNDALASDLRTLGARLGVQVRLRRGKVDNQGKEFKVWRGEIRFVHRLPGKNTGQFQALPNSQIVAIRASRARKFWDIAVADDPHVFALASGVLTHNSMPESVKDRPGGVVESIFILAKSESYYFDMEAVRVPHAMTSWTAEKEARGELARGKQGIRSGAKGNARANGAADGQRSGKTSFANGGYTQSGRNFRSSDLFFKTWQGLLSNDDGDPLAMVVNPVGFSGAHFACFPPLLPEIAIKASTSAHGVCPKCGAPYRRLVERGESTGVDGKEDNSIFTLRHDALRHSGRIGETPSTTTGWAASCTCDAGEPVSATVLDPFAGSGTTLRAAMALGRNPIGCDLGQEYLTDLAPARLSNVQIEMAF